jgi:signal transduction histidine kinase
LATVGEQGSLDTGKHRESAPAAPALSPAGQPVNAAPGEHVVPARPGRTPGTQGRRSLRLRLSLLYGGLFLASGAVLLAIAYAAVAHLPLANPVVHVSPGGLTISPPHAQLHVIQAYLTSERTALLHGLLLRSGLALALMAAVSLWLGWLMAGRVLRPLRMITTTTRQISEENLHQRLALSGPQDELHELGDTIDGLLGRLEGAFGAQRSFVANASHELRTPLASMRVAIDVATRKSPPLSKDASILAGRIRADLGQADRILESLLVLARAQRGMADLKPVSLTRVVMRVLVTQSQAAADRAISVSSTLDEVEVIGDETLLSRLAANLVDNAIRHSSVGEFLSVTVKADGSAARMTVENGGPLLPDDKIGELTQPFRRVIADRTGSDDGVGLGLAIVAEITTAHRGTLELQGRSEGGLRVTVTLPRAANDENG